MKLKSAIFFLGTAFFLSHLGSVVASASTSPKLGYVDMQKAITMTTEGKKAKDQLEKEFKKKQAELKKKEDDLKEMSKDFEKKSLVLSDDVKLKKQQELQEEMLRYRELVGKSQLEIQKKERDLTMPIVNKLKDLIGEMAKKEGYTMILEKSEQSVLWAVDSADLTGQLVKAFESSSKK